MPRQRAAHTLTPLLALLVSLPCDVAAGRLEEVVVTAQRVTESAQDTPISLVSLDTDTLEKLGISGIADIDAQVPGLVIDAFPSSNQTLRLFIRGIGITDVQVTQDPAVGVYLDGVYLARSTGLAADIADLERIEVLRGPQGTLYGRNTTGGALNLITARPDPARLAFSQDLGAGSHERRFLRTRANLPLSPNAAVKLSYLSDDRDGFIANNGPGRNFGDRDAEGYRLDLRWLASDALTVDYSWDKSRLESVNYTPQAVLPGVPSGTPADAAVISSRRFVPYAEDRLARLSTSVPMLPNDTVIEGHSLVLSWQQPGLALKSISAWRELEDLSYIDFASGASAEYRVDFSAITLGRASPAPLVFPTARTDQQQDQLSQEFQLFLTPSEQFELVAGVYWLRERASEAWQPQHHIFSFPLIETGDTAWAVNLREERSSIENTAAAVYAQGSWSLRPDWQLTLGWRHSRDRREVDRLFRQDNYVDFGTAVLGPFESIDFSAEGDKDFSDNAFTLILEHEPSDPIRLYAKLVEAYKSGGFNTRDPDPDYFARGFDEEHSRSAELGFKSEWLGQALRINGALFSTRFDDLQLNFLLPASLSDTRVFNSGNAHITGAELEASTFLGRSTLLRLDYAYLDSDIDDVADPFTGELRAFYFDNAPRHSAALNIDHSFPPLPIGTLTASANLTYLDERKGHSELLRIPSRSLLNLRLALADLPLAGGELAAALWVRNALDEEYIDFTIDNLPHASRAVLWGETRASGIDISYRY